MKWSFGPWELTSRGSGWTTTIYRFGTNPGEEDRAASCRPLRSWSLGRRSGRVAALPYPPPKPFLIVAPCQHGRKDQSDQMACRAVSRAILLRSRAASSLRSRSAKIRTSRPANLSAGVI